MASTWRRLGSTTLGSAGDTITVDGLDAVDRLRIEIHAPASGTLDMCYLRFNNDSGSNYSVSKSNNGAGTDSNNSITGILWQTNSGAYDQYATFTVYNNTSKEKLVILQQMETLSGASNAPERKELTGKWSNTSAQITRVDAVNGGSGDFATGSKVTVFGATDDVLTDTQTDSTIFEETDTGKHYIWNATSDSWTEIA